MGVGAGRPIEGDEEDGRPLSPQLGAAMERALARLENANDGFRTAREDERNSQMVKRWNRMCREIDGHLRAISSVLIHSHQLSLDMGSEGVGRNIRPWLEETTHALDRLTIKLDPNDEVVATVGEIELLRGELDRVSYEWVEEAVVNWVLTSVDLKVGRE